MKLNQQSVGKLYKTTNKLFCFHPGVKISLKYLSSGMMYNPNSREVGTFGEMQ